MNPEPPRWALEEGILGDPVPGESYGDYWARHGYAAQAADALDGLGERVLPLAHARMGSVLQGDFAAEFDVYVSAYLLRAHGRRRDVGWLPPR